MDKPNEIQRNVSCLEDTNTEMFDKMTKYVWKSFTSCWVSVVQLDCFIDSDGW